MKTVRTVHDGFDKQVWLDAYDDAASNFPWCMEKRRQTPLEITPEQILANIEPHEQLANERWPAAKGHALELGADWGRFALYKVLTTEMIYEACNVSKVMTEHLQQIAYRLNLTERLNCHVVFAEDISFPDKTFDRVYAFETLEHVGELDRSLQEISRVLKRGGSLIFSLPLLNWADGGYHTQKHSKEFWQNKFVEHGFTGEAVALTRADAAGCVPSGEVGLVGCVHASD